MITTFSSELSVTLCLPRRTCILDPMLALSSYGVPLVKQLSTVMDIWVGKEFWHVLDNIQFYLQRPELLLINRAMPDQTGYIASFSPQEIRRSLQDWARFRQEIDLKGLRLFWVGDRLDESSLPQSLSPSIIQDYENLARSLEDRIPHLSQTSETLTSLLSDTIALSASLKSSFILTRQYVINDDDNLPPEICLELESFGFPCQTLKIADKMVAIEQDYLRQLFVLVGLSKFLWAGLKLNILHLLVPSFLQPAQFTESDNNAANTYDAKELGLCELDAGLWCGTKCFLYQL
jgi:hypothetical protein